MGLFPEQKVVTPLSNRLYQKAGALKIPLSGTFELSPLCNFSCKMCYVRKTNREVVAHSRPMMTLDEWIDVATEARKQGMLYLLLTGGEPLMWPDFWALYDTLYEMGFLISVNTNGSLIDDNVISHWKQKPPHRINITLYGATDKTYEALCDKKTIAGQVKYAIYAIKHAGLMVKLNCSLTPYNAADLEEMIHFAKEQQVVISVTSYMYPPVRRDSSMTGQNDRFSPKEAAWNHIRRYRYLTDENRYQEYLKNILEGLEEPQGLDESCIDPTDGRIRCRAGSASFWITWDGYLTPCGMMPEPKVDFRTYGFDKGWNELVQISSSLKTSSVCEQCPDQQMCHSCAAMAYAETGTTSGIPTYLCEMVHAMRSIAEQELKENNCN